MHLSTLCCRNTVFFLSLLVWLLQHVPAAHRSHEIEPQPHPTVANARGCTHYSLWSPSLYKKPPTHCTPPLALKVKWGERKTDHKTRSTAQMEEGKPSKTVCYRCFHGDQLRFSFDNAVCCRRARRARDCDKVFGSQKKDKDFTGCFFKLAKTKWVIRAGDYLQEGKTNYSLSCILLQRHKPFQNMTPTRHSWSGMVCIAHLNLVIMEKL